MNNLNILQIIDCANKGGAEREMCLISKEMSLRGHHIFLIHPPGKDTSQFSQLESNTLTVVEYPLKQKNVFKTILFLNQFIRKNKISIIHSHLYFSDFVSFLARIGLFKVKHYITLHMYLLASKPKIAIRKYQFYICAFFPYLFSTKIFAVSNDLCKHTSKYFLVPKKKIIRIFNGLNFDEFTIDCKRISEIKERYQIKENDTVLLCLGLLTIEKGQSYIVDAIGTNLSEYKNIKCFLLGSNGGHEQFLRDKIKMYNCEDRIFLPGFQTDICNWLKVSTIYVHPTLNDAMPLSLIEAMYLKRPVITTDLPTFEGFVTHQKTGLIVKKKSVSDIANAISLLINNPPLYNEIQDNAYSFALSNCSIKVTVDNILKNY